MSQTPPNSNRPRLPDEVVGPASASGTASLWIAVAVAVVVLNVAAFALLQAVAPNKATHQVRLKWDLLEQLDDPGVSLILGDSSMNQGLDPKVMEKDLGGQWVNLATYANYLTLDSAWMLHDYIERNGPPERVVLGQVLDMWHRGTYPDSFALVPEPWGYWSEMNPPISFGQRQQVEIVLSRYVPLYSADQSLRLLAMYPWRADEAAGMFRDDGYMPVHESVPERVDSEVDDALQDMYHPDRKQYISKPSQAGLEEIARLAQEHGFNVYLINSPLYDALWDNTEVQAYYQKVREDLEAIAANYPRLILLRDRPMTFPREMMHDSVDHVMDPGAMIFSEKIAEQIRAYETSHAESKQGGGVE